MKRIKRSSIHWLLIPHRTIVGVISTAVITCLLFGLAYVVIPDRPRKNPLVGTMDIMPIKPHTVTETSYLGLIKYGDETGNDTTNKLNLLTGEISELFPSDYHLISWSYYNNFPTYEIIQKDNDIYLFNVLTKTINPILYAGRPIHLAKDQELYVQASITEQNQFIFVIFKVDLTQISEFDGSHPALSKQTYSFDALTNTVTPIPDTKFVSTGCSEYDSLNKRFFTWPCGEGVGTALPLKIADMAGNVVQVAVQASDLGLETVQNQETDIRGGVRYYDRLFYVYDQAINKVIVLDPSVATPTKKILTIPDTLEPRRSSNQYEYSLQLDKDTNTLVIGGNDFIQLMKFDGQNQAIKSRFITEANPFYANFVFLDQGKAYYSIGKIVRMIDLPTMTLEKSFPLLRNYEVITILK